MRFFLLNLIILFTPGLQAQDQRAPVPGPEELKKAGAAVRELFKKEFLASDRPARRALSKRLLEESAGAKDAPEKFALLTEAVQAGVDAVDPWSSFRALDALGRSFQVDLDELRVATMNRARKAATSPEDAFICAEGALSLWETYMTVEGFDRATFWAKEAETLSKLAKDAALTQAAKDMAMESIEAKKAKQKSDDSNSHYDIGLYLVAYRLDFGHGLPELAQGPPGALRDTAGKEISPPKDSEAQADLSSAWQALAISEKQPSLKRAFVERARYWRTQALEGASGLSKTKVLKKLFPSPTILKATFGGPKGDVTKTLQEVLDARPNHPIIFDEYLAGDLGGTAGKSLTIDFQLEKQRGTIVLQPGEVTFVPPLTGKDAVVPPPQFRYTLLAVYSGAGAVSTEVTPAAKSRLPDPYSTFGTEIAAADTNPFKTKTLTVVAEVHGRRFVRSVRQGQTAPMVVR